MRTAGAGLARRVVQGGIAVGLAALLAVGCEGNDDGPKGGAGGGPNPVPPPSNMAMDPTPVQGSHACDLELTELAVYQGVKVTLVRDGQAVPALNATLIEGRRAYFRGFVRTSSPGMVSAVLSLRSSAGVFSFPGGVEAGSGSLDEVPGSTLNFDVPGEVMAADTSVALDIEVGSGCAGGSRRSFPTGGPMYVGPKITGTLKLTLVPVHYDADQSGRLPDTSEAQLDRYKALMMAIYPARSVEITVREPLRWGYPLTGDAGWGSFLDSLREQRVRDAAPGDVYYYGLVSPATSFQVYCQRACTAGLSYLADVVSSTRQVGAGIGFAGTIAGETLAHEIGHQHGRAHTPCGGGAGVDSKFPYPDGGIGVWGLDFRSMQLRPPGGLNRNRDLMGYCNPIWISDYNFNAIATRRALISGAAGAYQVNNSALTQDGFAIDRRGDSIRALQGYRSLLLDEDGTTRWGRPVLDGELQTSEGEQARVLDASGRVIDRVTVHRIPYGHGAGASFEVPAPSPGWDAIVVEGGSPLRFATPSAVPALSPM